MTKSLVKQFFPILLLIPLLSYTHTAYTGNHERIPEQQITQQEVSSAWVTVQPEVITSIEAISNNTDPAIQELLSYASETSAPTIAPYDVALAAVNVALDHHTHNNTTNNATQDHILQTYKQSLITGTAAIVQNPEKDSTTRNREHCFSSIRTRLLRANRICAAQLGANRATINNLTVAGNQTIDGNLTVNGTITNTLSPANLCSGGSVTLPCNVSVTGNQTITGSLTVNNNTTINGSETVNGDLTVNGSINGTIDPASLCSNGSLALPCDLNITGNQTITGNLTINGTIDGAINPASLCSNGSLTLPCNLDVTGTQTVSGLITANGGLTVNGNETVNGDLTVTGAINGTIDPASLCSGGSLTLPCDLSVTGNQTITGNLTVNSDTTINGNETINGDLTVTGTINGTIDPASLCSGGSLALPCSLSVAGDLTVTGAINGTIDPASLCSGGVAIIPCNLQFNSSSNTLNAIGNSAEPRLNLIRGTIAPNLTAAVVITQATITNNPFIIAGSGFTVAATPPVNILNVITIGALVGTIDVTFDSSVQFASRPSITLGTEDAPGSLIQLLDYRITNVSTTGFSIEIVSLLNIPVIIGLVLTAGNVNFMAIGPTV